LAPIEDIKQESKKDGPTEKERNDKEWKDKESTDKVLTDKEWKETEVVLTSFLRVWKNYSLYPQTHVNCKASLKNFHTQLKNYLKINGKLRFDFEKGALNFKGRAILSEPREEGYLTYNLFRDGIQWLQFKEGLEEKELSVFLGILNEYRILAEEPDGDLVTALWANFLPHIQYNIADLFWGAEPEMDFSTTPKPTSKSSSSSQKKVKPTVKETGEFESILPIDIESLAITHKEYEELNTMVRSEEMRDPTPDFLDALIDCLLQHKQKENFDSILKSFEEEFHASIARKDFDITQRILKSLRYVLGYTEAGTPWIRPAIDKLFVSMHSDKSLLPLQASWDDLDEKQLAKVKESLLLFQPDAIEAICNLFLQASSLNIQQMLMDVILSLASRDYRPIEALLNRPEEELVRKLVNVLGQIKGEGPSQILFKMVHHSSAKVRQDVINCLLQQDANNIQKLYTLINDENDLIRRTILNYMKVDKSGTSEDFLLNYLGQEKFKADQDTHVIECFKTLGRCGSNRCLPFLKKTLTGRGGLKDILKQTNRKGAAIVLKTMGTEDAIKVLEDASRSLYPNIRYIARHAMKG